MVDAYRLRAAGTVIAVAIVLLASASIVSVDTSGIYDDLSGVTTTTDKTVYLPGQTVNIGISIMYIHTGLPTHSFFEVRDAQGDTVYSSSGGSPYVKITTSFYTLEGWIWGQNNSAGQQVASGIYEIWGFAANSSSSPPVAGNSTKISIVERFDVNLVPGWNLVSLPLLATNYTCSNLGLPTGSVVSTWNSSSQSYGPSFIVGVSPASLSFLLENFTSYFIHVSSVCTVSIFGFKITSPQTFEWNLPASRTGWVFAGFPDTGTTHASSNIQTWVVFPWIVRAVAYYDASTQEWTIWTPQSPSCPSLLPGAGCAVLLQGLSSVATGTYGP